ncbi:MAG TPA: hypothetical protein VMS81_07900 [Methanomicrobiales archaeon]|jgi:hypothetical protein|nr:hypothetical protein [Methanomicrobiales archaeon]
MFRFRKPVWMTGIFIAVIIGIFILTGPVMAVPASSLNTTQLEGNSIQLSYTIDAYPKQTAGIELETDLVHYGNVSLWNIDDLGRFNITNPDQALNEQKLLLTLPEGWTSPIHLTIDGKVPTITGATQCNGVVLTRQPEKKTGFIFYRIITLDNNGDVVGTASTQTFDIDIPAEDSFRARVNALADENWKNIITDIHDEGLTKEADTVLSYAEKEPAQVPVLYVIGFSVLLVIIVGLGGYVIGFRKGKGRREEDEPDETEMD